MDITVWIIEDNPLYTDTVKDLINNSEGMYCPCTYSSCEAAIEALNKGSGEDFPDVLLMDINLDPNMNGVEGTWQIKSIMPTVEIVMLTVYKDNDYIFEALKAGAIGYMLKESEMDRIISGIREAYNGGAPMTGAIARKVLNSFRGDPTPGVDYRLTKREQEILEHVVEGHKQWEIGEMLFIAPTTVDTHIRNIYSKLHVNSRALAVSKAIKEGLV